MTVATTRMTLGSILGTVNNAANSVSSIINTTTKSVGMLDKLVSDASERQNIRSVVDMHDFAEKLAEEKAMEETQRKLTIVEFTSQSKINQELFEGSYNRIKDLINNRKG